MMTDIFRGQLALKNDSGMRSVKAVTNIQPTKSLGMKKVRSRLNWRWMKDDLRAEFELMGYFYRISITIIFPHSNDATRVWQPTDNHLLRCD